jgi:ammonium transporter, Amt family
VNPIVPPLQTSLSEFEFALAFALLLLAPLAIAGVALINTGLGRSRSAAQSLLGCLVIVATAAIVFAVIGAALAGSAQTPAHTLHLAGKSWNWLGATPLLLGGFASASPQEQLEVLFEIFAVAFAAIVPWGAGADRVRLMAGCAVAAILAAFVFPLFAHWVWGGGWLAQLGVNFPPGANFLDGAGASTIHVLGGLTALAVVWIAGARKGKFPKEGLSTAMPGHHAVYILFGCLLAMVGFAAWNAAGALLWLHTPQSGLVTATLLAPAALNTLLTASASGLAAFFVTRIRFGKPDASLCANGWLAGLAASSAGAAILSPAQALVMGLVAGVATPLLVELLELGLSIDDPSGAISVHAAGGLWGLVAVGIFSPTPGQLLAQCVGISALLGFIFPLVYFVLLLLNRLLPLRVDADGERLGMDLHELGGSAYPEFVVHRDDFYR